MSVTAVQPITRTRPTVARPRPRPKVRPFPPPLNPGDRLSRAEFERRYLAHPEIKKAELVEGVVYMPTPTRVDVHGRPHAWIMFWLGSYVAAVPQVDIADNSTVRLDFENEVQPDALLRLDPALGGRSRVDEDGYLTGPPELIVEIAASSSAYDLHDKKRAYARNGVQEYVAVQVYDRRIDWFSLEGGVYEPLQPDEAGILRSRVFPGLWLDVEAFWAGDLATMQNVLQQGLASEEYIAFANNLQKPGAGHLPGGE